MSILRTLACALAVSLGAVALGAPQFQLSVFPVFLGSQKAVGLIPLKVSVANFGSDATGMVHIQSNGYQMDYPVELPEGSSKDLIVYTTGESLSYNSSVELRTNRGTAKKAIDPAGMTPSAGDYFLEIGGNPGDLGFLAGGATGSAQVSPENAPDRVSAYEGCNMILLASGSERLSDGAVQALKLYLLRGGLLVFPSGVASPLLTDGRWQGILPVQPLHPRTAHEDSLFRSIAAVHEEKETTLAAPINGVYSVVDFTPLKGTKTAKQAGKNLIGARNYGLGKAVFWGFDPLHGTLRDWPGLAQFFRRSAHYALPGQQAVIHDGFLDPEGQAEQGVYTGGAYTTSYGYSSMMDNAFQVTMPTAGSIGTVLALYFLFVIPVNFLVLKRLGKRHWGWVTSCGISIVFAGIMLSRASQLYGIPTSHVDQIVVVGQRGFDRALAVGSSQMFAAQGGTYDLSMEHVESVSPATDNPYFRSREQDSMDMFSPVDVGEVQIKQAQFKNLGFGEMKYEQELDTAGMPLIVKKGRDYLIKAGTRLENACFFTPERGIYKLGTIPAGATVTANLGQISDRPTEQVMSYFPAIGPWLSNGECVLMASAPDLPLGPTLGKKLPPAPVLIYFAGDDL